MRYEMNDHEQPVMQSVLPDSSHGVLRVDDRRVLRSGAPQCDLPNSYGPSTTC